MSDVTNGDGENGDGVQQGISPYADAWRRLKKNRAAMAGLWIVVIMSALATFAPLLAPFDAQYGFTWIGAQPMGYSHPNVLQKNRLELNKAPEVTEGYMDAATLEFEVRRLEKLREYAIFSDPKTGEVTNIRDALRTLDTFESVEVPEGAFLALKPKGRAVEKEVPLPAVDIAVGKKLPERFKVRPNEGLVLFLFRQPEPDQTYVATLSGGMVKTLTVNGDEIDKCAFDGRDVRWVKADDDLQVATHWLGTDLSGRDVYSRVLYGARISLLVGLVATLVSLLIGVIYGAVSGYAGGKVDMVLMGIVDILYGIPYMFLVILLLVNFGRDIIMLFLALGAVQWLTMARIVRGQILSLREKEFVEAARMCGTGHSGILFGHLIPNTLGVVVVYTTLTVPAVILQESFLAFIGLTVEYDGQSLDSWGALVKAGMDALGSEGERSWLLLWPSIAMAATLFSLNFLGDGLRDALDPQQRGRT